MVVFYLVRHGQKEQTPFDPQLTSVGLRQAEATSQHLRHITFQEIVTSPKARTRQTAEIISKPHNLEVIPDNRLVERLEWHEHDTFDAFMNQWSKTDIDRSYVPTSGMSSLDNGERMRCVLEEYAKKYVDGNILIVTHGGTIGDVLRSLFSEKSIEHTLEQNTGASYIDILECSITTIKKTKEGFELLQLGDISHLARNR